MIPLALLSFGIAGLWAGTTLALRGALALSERYGLSHGFVGLAVLAVGTDLPELVVAIDGGLKQLAGVEASGMIVGSAVGSAIVQGSLVLGLAGLVGYIPSGPRMVRRYGSTLLFAIGLAALLFWDGSASRLDGAILLSAYGLYFVALFRLERRSSQEAVELPVPGRLSPTQATALGLLIVVASAHMVVEGGVALAAMLGMSQTLLAVIFVGMGTSLPELALSLRAAAERHGSLSLGNVIGSNIFDLLVPVGAGALIHPLTVSSGTLIFDLPAAAVVTVAAAVFLTRKRGLQRPEAAIMILLYLTYVTVRIGTA
jgi:cation:H+ antiporter